MTKYILNAAVITNYGVFKYIPITLSETKQMLKEEKHICAIGHDSTAQLFSLITEYEVEPNRLQVKMEKGDTAIVFWANRRLPEGYVVQTVEELQEIGFTFGLIEMILGVEQR